MRVSYLELYVHCKKVLEACGVPYGCAEEGAEAVAWGQFSGLSGLNILKDELERIQSANIKDMKQVYENCNLFILDGGGQSGLLTGKVAADCVLAKADEVETTAIYVTNTSSSSLLAQQAAYIASKGMGCMVYWMTEEGQPTWAVSLPNHSHPTIVQGHTASVLQKAKLYDIYDNIQGYYKSNKHLESSNGFLIICTKKGEILQEFLEVIKQTVDGKSVEMILSETLSIGWKQAWENGGEVDRCIWDELNKTGRKILVESSELSRLRGAGELA